jgi:hypothetical protein
LIVVVVVKCCREYFFVNGVLYKKYKFGNVDPLSDVPASIPYSIQKEDSSKDISKES